MSEKERIASLWQIEPIDSQAHELYPNLLLMIQAFTHLSSRDYASAPTYLNFLAN